MDKFLNRLRRVLMEDTRLAVEPPIDIDFGKYDWAHRYSANQTPLEFDFSSKGKSWYNAEDIEAGNYQIVGPGSGLAKRQATLQLCYSCNLTQPQPRPCVLFRGLGRISALERAAYAPGVKVLWQAKAWFDREVAEQWIEEVWGPFAYGQGRPCLLITDNLNASATSSWTEQLREWNTVAFRGEPNSTTHIWQLIDRGPAMVIKELIAQDILRFFGKSQGPREYRSFLQTSMYLHYLSYSPRFFLGFRHWRFLISSLCKTDQCFAASEI